MDRHEREELALRAREAKMLMDHKLLRGAFHDVREALVESIENGALEDDKVRDKLFCSLQCLKLVKEAIEAHVETGVIINNITTEEGQ